MKNHKKTYGKTKRGILALMMIFSVAIANTVALEFERTNRWYVNDVTDPLEDGSSEHPFDTIQEGINAASGGDTVLVLDGTYTGTGNRDIDFFGKEITVQSENGPDHCIIDSQASSSDRHRGFYFHSGEGINSIVQGFTIEKGYHYSGGGIYCYQASPTIINNVIEDNWVFGDWISGQGGGIYLGYSNAVIIKNIIELNWLTRGTDGGGIYCSNSNVVIKDNRILNNHAYYGDEEMCDGGGISCILSTVILINNLIEGNVADCWGGGLYIGHSTLFMSGNTIFDNHANNGGGMYINTDSFVTVADTILWDNGAATYGREIILTTSLPSKPSYLTINYSDVDGGQSYVAVNTNCFLDWGSEMIDADPLFVGDWPDNRYLSQIAAGQLMDSPCVNAGDPASTMIYGSTRTDGIQDFGIIDMGYHYPVAKVLVPQGDWLEDLGLGLSFFASQ